MLTPTPAMAENAANDQELQQLRDLLSSKQAELEDERRKTDWLYQSFLPSTTAAQILNKQQPESGNKSIP